jgi:hypothetical protein
MFKNRLFNLLVAAALVMVVALTVREAFATASLAAHTATVQCNSLPSRYSIHTKNVGGTRWTYTEDGPTGVDGGLIQLLSSYRTCSR